MSWGDMVVGGFIERLDVNASTVSVLKSPAAQGSDSPGLVGLSHGGDFGA